MSGRSRRPFGPAPWSCADGVEWLDARFAVDEADGKDVRGDRHGEAEGRVRATAATATRRRHGHGTQGLHPAHHVATSAGARTLAMPSAPAVVELQRAAGNRAVTSLLRPLQRVGGWADADTRVGSGIAPGEPKTGWNVEEHAVGGIRRIPIDGLVGGLQSNPAETASAEELTDEKVAGKVKGAPRSDAKERAGRGRAIALVPKLIETKSPVDVFFHLHGHTEKKSRGFAGWRQHRDTGKVRDVERDRIAQQIEAAKSSQIVGILPQGVGESEFGSIDPSAYTRDAFDRLTELGAWTAAPPSFRLVLSSHSGSGFTAGRVLGVSGKFKPPANVKTLVLFEALHAKKGKFNQADQFATWLEGMLDGHLAALDDPALSSKQKQARLDDAMQVRLYWDPEDVSYNARYVEVEQRIDAWFRAHAGALGGNAAVLRNLVVFVRKAKVGHEGIVRSGVTESLVRAASPGAIAPATTAPAPTQTPPAPLPPQIPAPAAGPTRSSGLTFPQRVDAITPTMVQAQAGPLGPAAATAFAVTVAFGADELSAAAMVLSSLGQRDEMDLTDTLFALVYPELHGGRIPKGRDDMADDWRTIRRRYAKPALTSPVSPAPAAPSPVTSPPPVVGTPGPTATTPTSAAPGTTTPDPKKVKAAKAATGAKVLTAEEKKAALEAAMKQATKVGLKQDRDDISNTLLYNGTDDDTWWGGMVFDAAFLDVPIEKSGGDVAGIHSELYSRLQIAEQRLIERFPGLSKAQIAGQMGIKQINGLRPPKKATGGSAPSFHCFGLAVDINHPTNPFIGNKKPTLDANADKKVTAEEQAKYDEYMLNRSPRIIERAMFLIRGEQFDIEQAIGIPKDKRKDATAAAGHLWDVHHRASDTLAEYLRLADDLDGAKLKGLVEARRKAGDTRDLASWKQRIATDKLVITPWDFMYHTEPEKTGYMDLARELIEALAGDAGLLWGGAYGGAKDMMHFDWRKGTIDKRAPKGWKAGDQTQAEEEAEKAAKKAARAKAKAEAAATRAATAKKRR